MSVITLNAKNFEKEVLQSSKPVLVDFWASWCGPCRMMSPIVESVAESTSDAVVGKVNVDDEPELARKYGVMSIPTLAVFKNGQPVKKSVGVKAKDAVLDLLKN
jgi:thioredoxin 1